MESVDQKTAMRLKKIERSVHRWRTVVLALLLVLCGRFIVENLRANERITTFTTPFELVDSQGRRVLYIDKYQKSGSPVVGSTLTLYAAEPNSQQMLPAASFVASGDLYKDAQDPAENYLNVLETYLYEYPKGSAAQPYETSSLALTRAGGSLMIWNRPRDGSSIPTHAARLTAKRGIGGELVLSTDSGKDGNTLKP